MGSKELVMPNGISAGGKVTTSGTINSLDVTGLSKIILNNTTTINGFANGIDGQEITIMNPSATLCTINHNNGSGTQKIFVPSKQKCILQSSSGQISAGKVIYSSDAGGWFYLGADYDEGAWTPSLATSGGTLNNASSTYSRIGKQITLSFYITAVNPSNNGNGFAINVPSEFLCSSAVAGQSGGHISYTGVATGLVNYALVAGSGGINLVKKGAAGILTNATVIADGGASFQIIGQITYLLQ